ncbi:hypothetical protein GCM10027159_07030 [Lysobacter terrae]
MATSLPPNNSFKSKRLTTRLSSGVRPLMRSLRKLLVLSLLLHCSSLLAAEFDAAPLSQIQADVGPGCAVEPIKSTLSLAGNNGLRIELWVVMTCNGLAKYEVSYYPPQFFPRRGSPYAVRRIK